MPNWNVKTKIPKKAKFGTSMSNTNPDSNDEKRVVLPARKNLSAGAIPTKLADRSLNDNDANSSPVADFILPPEFRFVRHLGSGGMGRVILVERETGYSKELLALKVISSKSVGDPSAIERFKKEVETLKLLRHENIVPLRDFGFYQGYYYFLMEFVDGVTLEEHVRKHGPLAEEKALGFLVPIAIALDYAHSKMVIHRDVKPTNIMIDRTGKSFLLDFGVAKNQQHELSEANPIGPGTWEYMAPEQFDNLQPTPATDVYGLGSTLFYALSGKHPFKFHGLRQLLSEKEFGPDCSAIKVQLDLVDRLRKSMLSDPKLRPKSCVGVFRDSKIFESVTKENATLTEPTKRLDTKAWLLVGSLAILLMAIAFPSLFQNSNHLHPVHPKDGDERTEQTTVPAIMEPNVDGLAVQGSQPSKSLTDNPGIPVESNDSFLSFPAPEVRPAKSPGQPSNISDGLMTVTESPTSPIPNLTAQKSIRNDNCLDLELIRCVQDDKIVFWIGKYEVTQFQWETLMESQPSYFQKQNLSLQEIVPEKQERFPVENISWIEANVFCETLTAKERLAGRISDDLVYRLPTEEEWWTVAGRDVAKITVNQAWFSANADNRSHEVGLLEPNALGIFDLFGNVEEMTTTLILDEKSGEKTCLVLGGSWFSQPSGFDDLKERNSHYLDSKRNFQGFRVVLGSALGFEQGN